MYSFFKSLFFKLVPRWIFIRDLKKNHGKSILLTFDDAPHPIITKGVLDRLKKHNVRAVFYIIGGRINKAPHLVKRMAQEGHVLANHTFIHSYQKKQTLFEYVHDLKRCQKIIEKHTGIQPLFFRPRNGTISLKILISVMLVKLKITLWSSDEKDWDVRTSEDARKCAGRIIKNVKPGDIVLLHADNAGILEILDIILPQLTNKGFDLCNGINHLYKNIKFD